MRLPTPQFRKLIGPHLIDPEVFGLRVVGYDRAVHLECVDRVKLQQTLWAIEESVECGDKYACALYRNLKRL